MANSLAHYFPQHIEITVSGTPIKNSSIASECLSETGGFYNLIADFVINRQAESDDTFFSTLGVRIWNFWSSNDDNTILENQTQWQPNDTLECINPIDIEEMLPLSDRQEIFNQIKAATMSVSDTTEPVAL